ncbi:dynein regulatory complex subunit 4 isoform X2 [Nothobranchius furzeri]|uniref:Dynein regulatory complex subunit 4 n=3 Tax=Nothobranchius furzeri TaxID=105023 RepID=A0A8C6NI73_NOTFU|nr:transcript variant X1 [Nothobranchius furzeri]
MPPRTKQKNPGKGKSSAEMGRLSTEEMSKDQLEEHIVRLREELDREREEKSFFQLERDKTQDFWEISKRKLQEAKAELRNRDRERDEAEERHQVEITVYKQKLKHVLSEQQNTISEMKMDTACSALLVQNQNTDSGLELHRGLQNLQMDFQEKLIQEGISIMELRQKHQVELMELNNKYRHRLKEVEQTFQQRMDFLVTMEDKKRESAIRELENHLENRMGSVIQDQDRVLRQAEEFYTQVIKKQLSDQEVPKAEALRSEMIQKNRKLERAQQKEKVLKRSLKEAEQKVLELQEQLQKHVRFQEAMKENQGQQKVVEKELKDLMVEYELLLQAFQKVEQERDELLQRQMESILDVQQRSSLKRILLEKKLSALTETLEEKEAQLCTTLSVSSIDPTTRNAAANKLQEVLEGKRATIDALQADLAGESMEDSQLLHSWKEQLQATGVSPQDVASRTTEHILEGTSSVS